MELFGFTIFSHQSGLSVVKAVRSCLRVKERTKPVTTVRVVRVG